MLFLKEMCVKAEIICQELLQDAQDLQKKKRRNNRKVGKIEEAEKSRNVEELGKSRIRKVEVGK